MSSQSDLIEKKLNEFQEQLDKLSRGLAKLRDAFNGAEKVTEQFRADLQSLENRVEGLENNVPTDESDL